MQQSDDWVLCFVYKRREHREFNSFIHLLYLILNVPRDGQKKMNDFISVIDMRISTRNALIKWSGRNRKLETKSER